MKSKYNAWKWIPSLYYAEGLPYVIVMSLSVIMYKRLGLSNTDIALYTSWLYLPWVIKPLWSPIVDILKSKRYWIVIMQLLIGVGFAGIAFSIPAANYVQYTLAFFWLMAFSSATHDIAADGFYMLGLNKPDQAFFVGIRSTFYRGAMITGQGLLVILAGFLEKYYDNVFTAWSVTFWVTSILFLVFAFYHKFMLPFPELDKIENKKSTKDVLQDFINTFKSFFKKKNIVLALSFIMFYRFGESQLVKIASPFLLDSREAGGLALDTEMVGLIYGTIGIIALTIGGILGGVLTSKNGLKYWLWPMLAAINIPNALYILLAFFQPESELLVSASVAIEQFGYGFGFTAFMLYIIYIAEGEFKTAHYAIATGFMALGMMIPGMISGWIQELIGYKMFFVWVLIATLPSFVIAKFIKIESDFGRKVNDETN